MRAGGGLFAGHAEGQLFRKDPMRVAGHLGGCGLLGAGGNFILNLEPSTIAEPEVRKRELNDEIPDSSLPLLRSWRCSPERHWRHRRLREVAAGPCRENGPAARTRLACRRRWAFGIRPASRRTATCTSSAAAAPWSRGMAARAACLPWLHRPGVLQVPGIPGALHHAEVRGYAERLAASRRSLASAGSRSCSPGPLRSLPYAPGALRGARQAAHAPPRR